MRRIGFMAAVVALLAACRSDPPAANDAIDPTSLQARGQHLFSASVGDPKTFNPIIGADDASSTAFGPIFDPLLRLNPETTEMEPGLAERWEISEDGKECTLYLRQGVHWHDGKDLTADDVLFTFAAIYDDRIPNSFKSILTVDGQTLRVDRLDDFTVRLRLPRPFAPLINSLGIPVIPRHILGDALQAGTFAHQWNPDTPPERVIGSGPFRLERYVPGQYLQYSRNPDYWMRDENGAPLPVLERQTIRIVPDEETMFREFLARQTDIYMARPEDVSDLRSKQELLNINLEEAGLDIGTLMVTFNRNPRHYVSNGKRDPRLDWFTDKAFLRAIAHSIDKDSIINSCLSGFGRPAVSHLSPANKIFYDPHLLSYPYDLARAGQILSEAGYVDRDGDGIREDPNGNPLRFELNTNTGNQVREKMCSILKGDWTKLGIQVIYRPLDFALLLDKIESTFDWDAIVIGFTGGLEPHNGANLLHSSGNLHLWYPNQDSPATAWEAEIDGLLDAGSREFDPQRRQRIYWRIQEIMNEELPMIPTVRRIQLYAFRKTLQNFRPTVWGLIHPERIRFAE